ncbi:GNAT family N-acetyltransferase [Piscibacillus halophilus]|uniref:GNAT family N-acetyltransferase n=1 Tax=Piscibacillus halophilus TaxID=571933 RepID=UPI0024098AC5|nr:GNAT family N-acetyltransferase [Piscibacillus halophilus]
MEIMFKEINQSNYKSCVELEVKSEQRHFVAPNWYSLLESYYEEGERHPLGIYKGDQMVGFIMYVFYPADEDYQLDSWWIERFMIGDQYQNQGLGKTALKEFLDYFKSEYGKVELRISTEPHHNVALSLYEKVGFIRTGEMVENEAVLCMEV